MKIAKSYLDIQEKIQEKKGVFVFIINKILEDIISLKNNFRLNGINFIYGEDELYNLKIYIKRYEELVIEYIDIIKEEK